MMPPDTACFRPGLWPGQPPTVPMGGGFTPTRGRALPLATHSEQFT